MTRAGGRSHAAPAWGMSWGEAFCFSTDRTSQKDRTLAANSAIAVHLAQGRDIAILEGTADAFTDPA